MAVAFPTSPTTPTTHSSTPSKAKASGLVTEREVGYFGFAVQSMVLISEVQISLLFRPNS